MKVFFFDLDGTLADSREGLHFCVRAALKSLGVADPAEAVLESFLGTPLPAIFRALSPAISEQGVAEGLRAYRAVYDSHGIRMNSLYPGVTGLLEAIAGSGRAAWIVTSKPQHYAEQVARLLGIERYFAGIVGAGLDEKDTKTGLVARALSGARVAPQAAAMLGDRHYDVTGARDNGVLPVGALWGYGSRDELADAGCRDFAATVAEFQKKFVDA